MRRLDTETERVKHQQQATTQAREQILRLAESRQDTLATSFAELLGDGGPSGETADQMIQSIREWRGTQSE